MTIAERDKQWAKALRASFRDSNVKLKIKTPDDLVGVKLGPGYVDCGEGGVVHVDLYKLTREYPIKPSETAVCQQQMHLPM